jgi:hypothetical protein
LISKKKYTPFFLSFFLQATKWKTKTKGFVKTSLSEQTMKEEEKASFRQTQTIKKKMK